MQVETKKYDSFIKRHKKAIIIVWLAIFLISIPFASKLFSVVSYNITGGSNSTQVSGNSTLQQVLLVVQNNDIYSNSTKAFLTQLSLDFPDGNLTSIYSIENSLLNQTYYELKGHAIEDEQLYLMSNPNSSINDAVLSNISLEVYDGFLSSVNSSARNRPILGLALKTFVTGVVMGYKNSTPNSVYKEYNFPNYPIMPPVSVNSELVDPGKNLTLVSMNTYNYSNASSVISGLADKSGEKVYATGAQALGNSIQTSTLTGSLIAILLGLVIAIIITGVIFRSYVAAFVPLLIFIINVVVSYSLFYVIFHFILKTTISFFDPVLTSILMLGLSTDYIIYILYRYRQERLSQKNQEKSASLAFGWAGGAVLVSGLTVISAYVVLSFFNLPFIGGSGILNAVGISVVLLTGITLLPAILHLSGDRLMNTKAKRLNIGAAFEKIAAFDKKYAKEIIIAFVLIAAMCFYLFVTVAPNFNILGLLPSSPATASFSVVTNNFGYDIIDPVSLSFLNSSQTQSTTTAVINGIKSAPGVYAVTPNGGALTGDYNIYLKSFAFTTDGVNTYNNLNSYLENSGVKYNLSGTVVFVASSYNAIENDVYPLIIILGIVIFVILFTILFSAITPVRLVLMLFSILLIANAITVLIFYFLLALPFIVIAQVFLIINIMGVGVDYDIFLVMRIREHVKKGETNEQAVRAGISKSGPIIISIGVILSSVFFGLAASGIPLLAEIGFIVGIGILIDTFVSILVIIPSFMFLLAKYNWWPSKI